MAESATSQDFDQQPRDLEKSLQDLSSLNSQLDLDLLKRSKYSDRFSRLNNPSNKEILHSTYKTTVLRIFEETDHFNKVDQMGLKDYLVNAEFENDIQNGMIAGKKIGSPGIFRRLCGSPTSYNPVTDGIHIAREYHSISSFNILESLSFHGRVTTNLAKRIHEYTHHSIYKSW